MTIWDKLRTVNGSLHERLAWSDYKFQEWMNDLRMGRSGLLDFLEENFTELELTLMYKGED